MSEIAPQNHNLATPEEAAAQLSLLSRADLVRLQRFARLRSLGLTSIDWEDLLHEAIDRVLAGTRQWPKQVPFISFLCGVMRSIASEHWRLRLNSESTELDDGTLELVADEHPSPERQAAARQVLRKIEGLFESDRVALTVLRGLANGDDPGEIQRVGNMTDKNYAAAQKRIRRGISQAMKEKRI